MKEQTFQLDDAQHYLDRVIAELRGLSNERKGPLIAVLEYISDHIRNTRNEILSLRRSRAGDLPSTTDELGEIVSETASATNAIMDAAETVERLAERAPPEIAADLQAAVTRIYEASAFQDITGQRIGKVIDALQKIEFSVSMLVNASCAREADDSDAADAREGDAALLNGPQLSGEANSQSEIDRLLEELG